MTHVQVIFMVLICIYYIPILLFLNTLSFLDCAVDMSMEKFLSQ